MRKLVITEPPSLAGALQLRCTVWSPGDAVRFCGASGATGAGGGPPGRKAMSCPTFAADAEATAVRRPVGPAKPRNSSAVSPASFCLPPTAISPCSTIPVGGAIEELAAIPKNPTSAAAPLVVTDGAVIELEVALAPFDASMGVVVLTPA